MKNKSFQKIGKYEIGQIVCYRRPEPDARHKALDDWIYIENKGTISSIQLCDSGALITINDNGQDIVAHAHLGIHELKTMAYISHDATLKIIEEAPRQMEIVA